MKIRINNKKILILMLILLLLILAVGYAVFSETLTISGTANAKGTFDLEFQNAEIVKNIGADREKTTAEISSDKNTLIVNVVDLAYPGAGVEFSVDIVNVGSIPAEVQAVTPTNVTGNDKIKVTGLDVIKADHPKIEAGDKCNIHFTIEWPLEAEEILENENSINFGLQIEYTQSTSGVFEGNPTHTDTDKNGNAINGEEVEKPEQPIIKEGKLVEIIEPQDYGKSINYRATVTNNETQETEEVSNWKVLYNDKNNIYLILDDFMPNNLLPVAAGLDVLETHKVYSKTSSTVLLNGIRTESYWSEFANGVEGAIARGAPTFEVFIKSYNETYGTNIGITPSILALDTNNTLYVSHKELHNGVSRYLLANELSYNTEYVWSVGGIQVDKTINHGKYYYTDSGIRPIVILPNTVEATVGETVEIKF